MDLLIPLPQKPHIVRQEENRIILEINNLYPGYGTTLGNSIRRVLYSSLGGAAITSIKIEGALHEFSTLDGVLEDTLEIALNLKAIRLITHTDEPQILKINAKGKKALKAKDIETPSQVEIVNQDTHIATLTSSSSVFQAEMTVEKGMGYVQVEQDSKEKKEIGVMRLDAIFSPIVKVNFDVENMRVGDRIDYNKLILDITTDGTIAPEDAYEQAISGFVDYFSAIKEISNKDELKKSTKSTKKKTTAKKK